jgi:hypothetical protein
MQRKTLIILNLALLSVLVIACSGSLFAVPTPKLIPTLTPTFTLAVMPTFTPANAITPTDTTLPTETPLPATLPPTSDVQERTKLNFEFPFEPSFPGYIVDIFSKELTANLACSLEKDKPRGSIIKLDDKAADKSLGTCDTKSMTLNFSIESNLRVVVILGGFPFIRETKELPDRTVIVTDDPSCSNCRQVEYDFKITRP